MHFRIQKYQEKNRSFYPTYQPLAAGTSLNWSNQSITPNQIGEIIVKYDTQRLDTFHENIMLFSNSLKKD